MRSPYPREKVRERESVAFERRNVTASYKGWTISLFAFACVAVLAIPAFGWLAVWPALFSLSMYYGRRSSQTRLLSLKGMTWLDVPPSAMFGFWLDWYEQEPDRHAYHDEAEIGAMPP